MSQQYSGCAYDRKDPYQHTIGERGNTRPLWATNPQALICRHSVGQGAAFLARILQFMETPQYLRK